jgi:hypothetical protein
MYVDVVKVTAMAGAPPSGGLWIPLTAMVSPARVPAMWYPAVDWPHMNTSIGRMCAAASGLRPNDAATAVATTAASTTAAVAMMPGR